MVAATQSKKSRSAATAGLADKGPPREVPIELIDPNPDNPRQDFSEAELKSLASSLANVTLMQPLYVEARGPRFQLLAGERRWRAAKLAGWKRIACYVVAVDRATAVQLMVDENLQRADLNALETARALALLTKPASEGGGGLTQAVVAARYGHQTAWATRTLALLKLPEPWRGRLASGEMTSRMGYALHAYAERPDVLAAVDLDRARNPDDWESSRQFEARLAEIVARLDGLAGGDAADAAAGDSPATIPLTRRAASVAHDLRGSGMANLADATGSGLQEGPGGALPRVLGLVDLLGLAELKDLADHVAARIRQLTHVGEGARRKAR